MRESALKRKGVKRCPARQIRRQSSPLRNREERLELANRLYREFQNRCFWHSPPELIVTEEMIPFVVKGLRTHGGHRGFMLADYNCCRPRTPTGRNPEMPLTPFQKGVARILAQEP